MTPVGHQPLDRSQELLEPKRLAKVLADTQLDRPDGVLFGRVAGHHHTLNVRLLAQNLAKGLEPVHTRHTHVGHDQVERLVASQLDSLLTAARRRHLEAFFLQHRRKAGS